MSIVTGYPRTTTDAQLDAMVETENARIWEEQCSHDAAWNRMLDAVGYMNPGLEEIEKAVKQMIHAKDEVDGLPAEAKIGSLVDSLEDILCDFHKIRREFINGEG